jgi:plasmid stability protein
MENPNAVIVCNLPSDLRERIKEQAKAQGRSVASEVRLLLSNTYPIAQVRTQ